MIWQGLFDNAKWIGYIAGGIAVFKTVVAGWNAGPGKRRVWMGKYRQLAPGVRTDFVVSLFGVPTFQEDVQAERDYGDERVYQLTERVWKLGTDGFLLCWSTSDSVVAYSLTTRRRRFRPAIDMGVIWGGTGTVQRLRLGSTRFAQLGNDAAPEGFAAFRSGASAPSEYYETYYHGNPGNYLHWAVGTSYAGRFRRHRPEHALTPEFHSLEEAKHQPGPPARRGLLSAWSRPVEPAVEETHLPTRITREEMESQPPVVTANLHAWRRQACINTVMVGREIPRVSHPLRIGPAYGQARLVAPKSSWLSRRRLRRASNRATRAATRR